MVAGVIFGVLLPTALLALSFWVCIRHLNLVRPGQRRAVFVVAHAKGGKGGEAAAADAGAGAYPSSPKGSNSASADGDAAGRAAEPDGAALSDPALASPFAGLPPLARSSVGGASVASQSSGAGSDLGATLLRQQAHRRSSVAGSVAGSEPAAEATAAAEPTPREPLRRRMGRWFKLYFLRPVFG